MQETQSNAIDIGGFAAF